jgi:hypothetical protein
MNLAKLLEEFRLQRLTRRAKRCKLEEEMPG